MWISFEGSIESKISLWNTVKVEKLTETCPFASTQNKLNTEREIRFFIDKRKTQ